MISMHGLKWSKNCVKLIASRYYRYEYSTSILKTKKNDSNNHIVWLDMEMSGLDVNEAYILEVACLITNKDLRIISEDLNIVVHQPKEILQNMNEWCMKTHKATGLIDESYSSKITVQDAEQILLKHLQKYIWEGKCPIAGSSVYMDRMFLQKYMPVVNNYIHYRIIDTSTIKELLMRWNLNVPSFTKKHEHRALSDIKESIKELEHYKKYIFQI